MRARIIFAAATPEIARLKGASDAARPVGIKKNCGSPPIRLLPTKNVRHGVVLRCRRSSHLGSAQTVATAAN